MITRPKIAIASSGCGASAYYSQVRDGLRSKFRNMGAHRFSGKRDCVVTVENLMFGAGISDANKRTLVGMLDTAVDNALGDEEIIALGREFIKKCASPSAKKAAA